MYLCYVLLFAFVLGYSHGQDDLGLTNFVFKGDVVTDPKEYPYIVLLSTTAYRGICVGTILNERWILSSAECSKYMKNSLTASYGFTKQSDKHKHSSTIIKITVHPGFDGRTFENDIALYKTKGPIDFQFAKTVKLSSAAVSLNQDVKIAGWGQTRIDDTISEHLRARTIKVQDLTKCQNDYRGIFEVVKQNHFCVIGKGSTDVACHGDFGAPILTTAGEQVGVVTWFTYCGDGKATVVTKVSPYISWINDNSKNLN